MFMRFDPFLDPAFAGLFARAPFVIYDAGAAGSLFTFFPLGDERSFVHGFEPNPGSCRKLRKKYAGARNVQIHDLALAAKPGKATLHVYGRVPESSSLHDNILMLPEGQAESSTIEVECQTLDRFCAQDGVRPPDFVKLDTEGSEHPILEGGRSTLAGQVLGVYSEVKFIPLSEDGTRFRDLNGLLEDLGFVFFDIQLSRMNRCGRPGVGGKKGAIESANVLYLRDFYRFYESSLRGGPIERAREKLVKLLALCTRYLYFDYALELVAFGRETGLLDAAETDLLNGLFCSATDVSWRVPDFPGKAKLALVFDYLSYALQPELKNSVPPMHNNLGNRRSALVRRKRPNRVKLYYPVRAYTDRAALEMEIDTAPKGKVGA